MGTFGVNWAQGELKTSCVKRSAEHQAGCVHACMYTKKRWGVKWRTAKRGGNKGNQSLNGPEKKENVQMGGWDG